MWSNNDLMDPNWKPASYTQDELIEKLSKENWKLRSFLSDLYADDSIPANIKQKIKHVLYGNVKTLEALEQQE